MSITISVSEHNLLFGVLALRANYIDVGTLHNAVNTWMRNRTLPLGEILRSQDKLSVHERLMVDAAVEERLLANADESADSAIPIMPAAAGISGSQERPLKAGEANGCSIAASSD